MIAFAAVLSFAACNDSETYKDMRDRELDSISSFLRKENIKVISILFQFTQVGILWKM